MKANHNGMRDVESKNKRENGGNLKVCSSKVKDTLISTLLSRCQHPGLVKQEVDTSCPEKQLLCVWWVKLEVDEV